MLFASVRALMVRAVPSGSAAVGIVHCSSGARTQVRCISASTQVLQRLKPRPPPFRYTAIFKRDAKRQKMKTQRMKARERVAAAVAAGKPRPVKPAPVSVVGDDTTIADDFKAIVGTMDNRKQTSPRHLDAFITKIKRTSSPETMIDDLMLVVELLKLYRNTNSSINGIFPKLLEIALEMEVPELACEVVGDRPAFSVFPTTDEFDSIFRALLLEGTEDAELCCDMLNLAAEDPAVLIDPQVVQLHFAALSAEVKGSDMTEMTDVRRTAIKELCTWTIYAWSQQATVAEQGDNKFTRPMETVEVQEMLQCVVALGDGDMSDYVAASIGKYVAEDSRAPLIQLLVPSTTTTDAAQAA